MYEHWLGAAVRSLDGAAVPRRAGCAEHARSIISRCYYASAAGAHAVLLRLGYTAPARGNWSNDQLPAALIAAKRNRNRQDSRWRSLGKLLAQDLAMCWSRRLAADCAPWLAPTPDEHVAPAYRCAGRSVHAAREVAR